MSNNCIIIPSIGIAIPTVGSFDSAEGGYFFGQIKIGASVYNLYISPRASGSTNLNNTDMSWKPTGGGDTGLTASVTDGWANTNDRNSATYPICQWARSLTINGKNDWYIPARDELELIYRNLRPGTGSNNTSIRPNQDSETNVPNGTNNNSVPVGAAYTTSNPPTTTVAAFLQAGGSEAVYTGSDAQYLCSSTQYSVVTGQMWIQSMAQGQQGVDNKPTKPKARVIRRVLAS